MLPPSVAHVLNHVQHYSVQIMNFQKCHSGSMMKPPRMLCECDPPDFSHKSTDSGLASVT